MELKRNSLLVYGLLLAVWVLVVGWQVEEHVRVKESAKMDLRNRSKEIANTVSAFIRGLRIRRTVFPDQLEPVLNELINGHTNELVSPGELISIVLLNAAGEPLASAGKAIDLAQNDIVGEGERWGRNSVTVMYPVEGTSVTQDTNLTVVPPPFRDLTNSTPEGFRGRGGFQRTDPRPVDAGATNILAGATNDTVRAAGPDSPTNNIAGRGERDGRPRDGQSRPRRPFWARGLNDQEYQSLIEKREWHGLGITMSTDAFQKVCLRDLWMRCIIVFFAGISALGVSVAWRNLTKSSDLQMRLIRASEMNSHLKEMNLAAAGLAHETRNPLNIIRGLAQMIFKQPDLSPEIRQKSREVIDETDRVTAQLNEFINYSRPREVHRSALALNAIVTEVVRTLNYDIEEKNIRLQVDGEPLNIQADEQLLRQALFNLVLNAVQAVDKNGQIEISARKQNPAEAVLEIRDNGPGVPAEHRVQIFKPYFTMQPRGTGLGLAVVQQIVLAHGWEIECLPHHPNGAVFRITHLRLAG